MAIKKSQDARTQLHVWNKLLEGRIALQKVLVAARDLEKSCEETTTSNDKLNLDENTIKSVSKLLTCLVRLRDGYREKSQFSSEENESKTCDSSNDEEAYENIDDNFLDRKHNDYTKVRHSIIEKWYEKTKIGTIPKKGYAALELPTLQLIQNSLKDKERLIKRTQLDRTSHLDDAIHPETFNDDDFYHHLLKEVISKEEGRKWVELQRLKYKIKRKADTKGTKGRKIKKDLIPKLVNFMAPCRPANVMNQEPINQNIRNELLKSLFGGSVKNQDQQSTLVSMTNQMDIEVE